MSMLVQLSVDDLRALVRTEIDAALAEQSQAPALLTQDALAHELGVSTRTIYELRQRGLPVVLVCDSPRFELQACIAWLAAQAPAARVKLSRSLRKGCAA